MLTKFILLFIFSTVQSLDDRFTVRMTCSTNRQNIDIAGEYVKTWGNTGKEYYLNTARRTVFFKVRGKWYVNSYGRGK